MPLVGNINDAHISTYYTQEIILNGNIRICGRQLNDYDRLTKYEQIGQAMFDKAIEMKKCAAVNAHDAVAVGVQ